jgi:cation diffusion facilitator family transporter
MALRDETRETSISRALRLEYITVGWNVVEGIVAVAAALLAGSVALLAFGVDSVVESASGSVLIWRLLAERRAADHERVETVERLAQRLVAGSLVALAVFIVVDAVSTLWRQERPQTSVVGIAVTALSIGVMWWLARAKREVAQRLNSRAMLSDAFQTTACWWLSLMALAGLGLNLAFGWWWADPVAALGITLFLVHEARESWNGDDCC